MVLGDKEHIGVAGNPRPYARGEILSDAAAEARKSTQGRRKVKERVLALGKDSIYNLTGLVRAFPLDPQDLPSLENQFTFYTHFLGRAEELALKLTGAEAQHFAAVFCNRVTSAMLAVMLGTLTRGDRVLSLVPRGRSHPSVQQAVELVGATFHEVQGIEALEQAITNGPWKMLVVTPLTPTKYHLPAADFRRAITLAKERDLMVFADDAHMMSRSIFYEEPVTFELGDVDLSVWSLGQARARTQRGSHRRSPGVDGRDIGRGLSVWPGGPVRPLRCHAEGHGGIRSGAYKASRSAGQGAIRALEAKIR